jgi:hypothetical protein
VVQPGAPGVGVAVRESVGVGGQSPAESEETVESDESDQSEGQGSSSEQVSQKQDDQE